MKFSSGPLFATLALTAYLPSILAVDGFAPRGTVAVFRRELAANGTAAANGTEVDVGNNEDDNAEEDNNEDDQNNEDLQKELEDAQNKDGINIDQNNLEESLLQNLELLMLGLGICNFDFNSLGGIGINDQIQLLLQLQQLQQLQQLGLVNSVSIEQLIQQELLLNNFNLNIFKRTISAAVKQGARESKRTVMARKECKKN
ncbi:hypothetical protein F4821DRAFT_229791 [Hypoxylon rubiginosum]|uniref:Uncharacterized protein n=1 Tax=Hypoxylon rubiginosum TaxID=110542 RepID=A0ACC0DC74_9PEZI|nr:hypothetical protein F4821DRAFT_229791 [Hypoxylon rubiginosum]